MFHYCVYPDRAFLRLSGADTYDFLQGVITNDVNQLKEKPGLFAALLSPQGKILHDFFLVRHGDTLLMDMEADALDSLLKKLKLYRLRSRVDIIDVSQQWKLYMVWGKTLAQAILPQGSVPVLDPRMAGFAMRLYCPINTPLQPGPEGTEATLTDFDRYRLEHAIPDSSRDASDRNLLLELGYDALNGVSFTKGCYIGQEVTARMHHRNVLRKCLFMVKSKDGSPLPPSGAPVTVDGREIGDMRSSQKDIGLAQVRIADWQTGQANGAAFYAGPVAIEVTAPDYMQEKLARLTPEEGGADA